MRMSSLVPIMQIFCVWAAGVTEGGREAAHDVHATHACGHKELVERDAAVSVRVHLSAIRSQVAGGDCAGAQQSDSHQPEQRGPEQPLPPPLALRVAKAAAVHEREELVGALRRREASEEG